MKTFCAALTLCAVVTSLNADTGGAEAISPQANLVLALELEKTDFVLYEPVTVAYKVENPTSEVITASVVLDASAGRVTFLITTPDGKTKNYKGRISTSIMGGVEDFEPGSVVRSEVDLDWIKGKTLAFPTTGAYEVHARLSVEGGREPVYLESNRLQIRVDDPSGVDAEAIAFFTSEEEFQRLMRHGPWGYCKGRTGPECFSELTQFLQEHGDSAYAPRTTWLLAEAVAYGGVDIAPKYELAVGLYRQFLESWPDHPNAPKVMCGLVLTLDKAGQYGEAAEIISEFETRFPEEKRKARHLRSNYESGKMLPSE